MVVAIPSTARQQYVVTDCMVTYSLKRSRTMCLRCGRVHQKRGRHGRCLPKKHEASEHVNVLSANTSIPSTQEAPLDCF